MTTPTRVEAWLQGLLEADETLQQIFAQAGQSMVVRRDPLQPGGKGPRMGIVWSLMDSAVEDGRCGALQVVDLTYQVKAVAPGDTHRIAQQMGDRIIAILTGATADTGEGLSADSDTVSADSDAYSADNGGTGAGWIVRFRQHVDYTEAAGPIRYAHRGGLFLVRARL